MDRSLWGSLRQRQLGAALSRHWLNGSLAHSGQQYPGRLIIAFPLRGSPRPVSGKRKAVRRICQPNTRLDPSVSVAHAVRPSIGTEPLRVLRYPVSRERFVGVARKGRVASHTSDAEARRAETQRRHAAEQKAWQPSQKPSWLDEKTYREKIQPRLAGITVPSYRRRWHLGTVRHRYSCGEATTASTALADAGSTCRSFAGSGTDSITQC